MANDEPYRRAVMALWVLSATAAQGDAGALATATQAAHAAVTAALAGETHFLLQERDGALFANGVRLRPGVGDFAAVEALVQALLERRVGELLFSAPVVATGLQAWARCWAQRPGASPGDPEAELRLAGADGVHASQRSAVPMVAPVSTRRLPVVTDGSQLRSVYLHHELMAGFDRSGPVPAATGHVVLQAVVQRLLDTALGPESLTLLQQDPPALRTAVHVCVLSALIARAAGAGEPLLGEIATAGLLHGVGARLDPGNPAFAGYQWLLGRGQDDLWLRAALVARNHAQAHGATVPEMLAESSLSAACVALAVRADQLLRAERQPVAIAIARLGQEAASGAFPRDLVAAFAESMAVVAGQRG